MTKELWSEAARLKDDRHLDMALGSEMSSEDGQSMASTYRRGP